MRSLFEVLQRGEGPNKSIIIPSAAPRGTFWSADTAANAGTGTDADEQITAKLADNADTTLLGFNARETTTTGLRTDAQILYEEGLEGYDKVGGACSVEPLPELLALEDEASHIHLSQTNPITAVNDLVNFEGGHARIAQSGETAFYKVIGKIAGHADDTKNRFILQKMNPSVKVA